MKYQATFCFIIFGLICHGNCVTKRGIQVNKARHGGSLLLESFLPLAEHEVEDSHEKNKAITELLGILGLQTPSENLINENAKHKRPPKYMVDLYRAVADDHGITKGKGLLNADMVRSITSKDKTTDPSLSFDIGAISDEEIIVDAELHFYQSKNSIRVLKNDPLKTTRPNFYYIKIYKVENATQILISIRRFSLHIAGWLFFTLHDTIKKLASTDTRLLRLKVEVSTETGQIIPNEDLHASLQPIIIVFTNQTEKKLKTKEILNSEAMDRDPTNSKMLTRIRREASEKNTKDKKKGEDRRSKKNKGKNSKKTEKSAKNVSDKTNSNVKTDDNDESSYIDYANYEVEVTAAPDDGKHDYTSSQEDDKTYFDEIPDYVSDGAPDNKPKISTFTTSSSSSSSIRSCRRYPLFVDFEAMGWGGWIIHPKGYNAYHCKGRCSFPLSQAMKPSNHATVQSIMHTMGLGDQPVDMPCCTPDKLYDINLLYFDQNDYVVLRRYKDMVVASCACR